MNLALFAGWPGAVAAALVAFCIGFALWWLWRFIALRAGWPEARAIGCACVTAVAIGAGIDSWHLFYLGVAQLESPVYVRIALSKIHDPDFLGTRVLLEWSGALAGVVCGWLLGPRRSAAGQ